MSFARLALRLAAVEALSPWSAGTTGAYPTPAGPRVFDSRQEPIDGLSDLETKPILIVYTEDDASTPYGNAKYPPDEQVVILVVEQMIAAKGTVEVNKPDGGTMTVGTLDSAISDQQQEGLIDLLEGTVRRLLDPRNRAPSSVLFNKVAMEIRHIESQPQRADDKITRLAARTLKLHIKVRKDAWPAFAAQPAPTGFDVLPQPLASVAAGLDPASSGAALCRDVVAQIQALQPDSVDRLDGIFFYTPHTPDAGPVAPNRWKEEPILSSAATSVP